MPQAWSNKDERQYEHIKESAQKRGKSTGRAKEIAGRTVNKQRKSEGRTKEQGARGQGEEPTKKDLMDEAKRLDIKGRSRMNKRELKRAVSRRSSRSQDGGRARAPHRSSRAGSSKRSGGKRKSS